MGIAIPVLPVLVGAYTNGVREAQADWYGALVVSYGLMQFVCSHLLGALADRFGRRTLLLSSIFGLGLHCLIIAFATSLWIMLIARVVGGIAGGEPRRCQRLRVGCHAGGKPS